LAQSKKTVPVLADAVAEAAREPKAKGVGIIVWQNADLAAPKTKELAESFDKLGLSNALIIDGAAPNANFALAARNILLMVLVTAWGVRLAAHIHMRNHGKGEDFRYRQWREEWGQSFYWRSYLQVFVLQALLLLCVATPVIYAGTAPQPDLGVLDALGLVIWLIGFLFEAVGDYQLVRFGRTRKPGQIMTSGLWKYTRHPNYFGEVTLWWGVYLIVCAIPGGWMTALGPVMITLLILKVSGIPMLEARYKNNAEFQAYCRRTSAFLPLPPRGERA